jgi:uncharacterized repeat protein (TIGR01451 family)/MYXO-CTERM domain-containing protein
VSMKKLLSVVALLLVPSTASAAPALRKSLDLRGDITAIGHTMGWDCGRGNMPPAGATATCTGVLEGDNAPDLYWLDNVASATLDARSARTSATLVIPAGATVTYAALYWSGLKDNVTTPLLPDPQVTIDRPGGASLIVTADASASLAATGPGSPIVPYIVYQSTADITSFVQANAGGEYRVTGIDGIALNGVAAETAYSAWTLVVAYSLPDAPYRRVSLFDGLDLVTSTAPASFITNGFKVPSSARGTMLLWAYDGDQGVTTDSVTFKGTALSNAVNPATDFFNSSRSILGAAAAGTVPAVSGAPGTMAGYDLDTLDIGSLLAAGDTTATVTLNGSTAEEFWFGGAATAISSIEPNIIATKTFTDLNGGDIVAGDVLEFTITAKNEGDDDAVSVVITDPLPAGLTYVPGSLKLGATALTDVAADDAGEVVGTTVTVRVGDLAIGASATVTFRATVSGSATVVNQGVVRAAGKSGAPAMDYPTDGDPTTPGRQGTTIAVTPSGDAGAGDTGAGDTGAGDGAVGDGAAGDTAVTDGAGDATVVDGGDASGDTSVGDTGSPSDGTVGDTGSDTSTGEDTGSALADSGADAGGDGSTNELDGLVAEGGGCGCRSNGSGTTPAAMLSALAIAALLGRRRR